MSLPTSAYLPDRHFQAQKFVRHVAADAAWVPSRLPGFEARDTGIAWATEGLGGVRVLRPLAADQSIDEPSPDTTGSPGGAHNGEFMFLFVLSGQTRLHGPTLGDHVMEAGDCCTVPAGADYQILPTADLQLLEVTLPAVLPIWSA